MSGGQPLSPMHGESTTHSLLLLLFSSQVSHCNLTTFPLSDHAKPSSCQLTCRGNGGLLICEYIRYKQILLQTSQNRTTPLSLSVLDHRRVIAPSMHSPSTTYSDPITSRTRWPTSIGCMSLRESSSRLPSWLTKSCTDTRRGTSALSHASPTYPVAGRYALSAPTAWQCLLPDCRLLAAELSRLSAHWLGTTCRKTWRQQIHCLLFVACSGHTYSEKLFRITCWTSTDCLWWT